jgi:hypothetical protein
MSVLINTRRKVAAGAVAALASVGAGVGAYALTAPAGASASASSAPVNLAVSSQSTGSTKTHKAHGHRTLLQRTVHATFEVKGKGKGNWVTVDLDRGKVVSVSATSIELSQPGGGNVTETITSSTKFSGISGESSIRTGVRATVISKDGDALRIAQRPAGHPAPTAPATPATPAA